MNKKLIIISAPCLLAGCGDGAKQPEVQGKGLRQYDKNVLARGERVFSTNCAVCHGNGGEANPAGKNPARTESCRPRHWTITAGYGACPAAR